jgi:hypothetical protein
MMDVADMAVEARVRRQTTGWIADRKGSKGQSKVNYGNLLVIDHVGVLGVRFRFGSATNKLHMHFESQSSELGNFFFLLPLAGPSKCFAQNMGKLGRCLSVPRCSAIVPH